MSRGTAGKSSEPEPFNLLARLRRRGVLRVAVSYAVIAWLTLQIGDVVLEPLGAPPWVMRSLIALVAVGFPVSLILAWLFELTPTGIERDALPADAVRPTVPGLRRYADVVIIGVLLVVVVVLLARKGGLLEEPSGTPVVGVLPFTELGVAKEEMYFGDGLADTLTYKLGQLQQLIVLAPTSTFQFRGADLDLLDAGAKLGATALLQGTVRRLSGTLQVNARLVDTASGRQLWAGSYDRLGEDLFAVQDEIATAVTDALHVVLSPADAVRLTRPATQSLSAYDAYLLGQTRLATRDPEQAPAAVEYFREAVKLDPDYALAHATLAEALYLSRALRPWERDWDQVAGEARRAAANAQALDPTLGEGYLAQAFVAMGDNELGAGNAWPDEHIAALLARAVELSPSNASALKFYAGYVNDADEELALLMRAAQLDPRSGIVLHNIAETYADSMQYESALEWFIRSAQSTEPYFAPAYWNICNMYLWDTGQMDVAARWSRANRDAHPDDWRGHLTLTRALIELGAWNEAEAALAAIPPDPESSTDRFMYWVKLNGSIRLALATGDLDAIEQQAAEFVSVVLESRPGWPDVTAFPPGFRFPLDAWALADVRRGRAEQALNRYQADSVDVAAIYSTNTGSVLLRTPVLIAALQKAAGNGERARAILRDLLEREAGQPIVGHDGLGFTRFTIHAFLGETDAAIAALDEAMEAGWVGFWWNLTAGDFDPDYAAVIADPRFQSRYAELEAKVARMRESYLAEPSLPKATLREAGLLPRGS